MLLLSLSFKYIHYISYFFYPTEKDYLGLLKIFDKNFEGDILDIGGNFGQSTISFIRLGFNKNKIHIFEANKRIFSSLKKVKKKYKNIYIYNFGLSNKNIKKYLYTPVINNFFIYTESSFNLKFLKQHINYRFPKIKNKFRFKREKSSLQKFDDLNLKISPKFIKVDVENHELEVISGMKNTIKKYKPIILLEYNFQNFKKIYNKLKKDYDVYIYNLKKNKMINFNRNKIQILSKNKKIIFENNEIRNIYFIPKKYNFAYE